MKIAILILTGVSAGIFVTNGIAMVLVVVGLLPRIIGKGQTRQSIFLYENMIIAGTFFGGICSIFPKISIWCRLLLEEVGNLQLRITIENLWLIIFGIFSGMFVGCLALAIAEMLDSIPILARRIAFRHGIGLTVTAMALGKLVGSIVYFVNATLQSP